MFRLSRTNILNRLSFRCSKGLQQPLNYVPNRFIIKVVPVPSKARKKKVNARPPLSAPPSRASVESARDEDVELDEETLRRMAEQFDAEHTVREPELVDETTPLPTHQPDIDGVRMREGARPHTLLIDGQV